MTWGRKVTFHFTMKWELEGHPSCKVTSVSITGTQRAQGAFVVIGGGAGGVSVVSFFDMLNCTVKFGKLLPTYSPL